MQVVKRDSRHGGIWLAGNAKRGSKSRHCAPFACCWRLVRAGTVKFGWQATQRGAASLDTARLLRAAGGLSEPAGTVEFGWQAMQRGAVSLDTARLLRAAGSLSETGIWLAGNAKRGNKSRHCAPFACCWRLVKRNSRHGGIWLQHARGAQCLDLLGRQRKEGQQV